MNRPSEELLHKTLENRATAAEAASVAEWLATDSGQAWASRYIGRDFDRQESCGDYEREEVASERIFARIKTALTRSRRRRILFRVAAVVIPVALVLGVGNGGRKKLIHREHSFGYDVVSLSIHARDPKGERKFAEI